MEVAQLFPIHESVISVAKGDDATTVPVLKVKGAKRISEKGFLFSLGAQKMVSVIFFVVGGRGEVSKKGMPKKAFPLSLER